MGILFLTAQSGRNGKSIISSAKILLSPLMEDFCTTHDGFSIPPFFRWRKYHNTSYNVLYIKRTYTYNKCFLYI